MEVPFVSESQIGDFIHPWSAMVCGVTGSGKTVFLSKIINETIKKKWFTLYITCQGYRIEEEKQITKIREDILKSQEGKAEPSNGIKAALVIAQAPNMKSSVIDRIIKLLNTLPRTQPKHLIFDNFTYDLSEDLLNLLTYNRKLNTSVTILMHDLFSNPRLGPRLRGSLKYSVLFYLGSNINNLRFFLTTSEMIDMYLTNVQYKNFKKLIWKNQENKACIADKDFIPNVSVDKDLIPSSEEVIFEDENLETAEKPADTLTLLAAQLSKQSGLTQGLRPDPSRATPPTTDLDPPARKGIASGKRDSLKSRGLQRKK